MFGQWFVKIILFLIWLLPAIALPSAPIIGFCFNQTDVNGLIILEILSIIGIVVWSGLYFSVGLEAIADAAAKLGDTAYLVHSRLNKK